MKPMKQHITRSGVKKYAMKGSILISLALLCMLYLGGCLGTHKGDYLGRIAESEQEQSDAIMQNITNALDAHDNEALKEMFSPSVLEAQDNLDAEIENLMNYYQGSVEEFEGDCISEKTMNHGKDTLILLGTYTLTTSTQEYHISFVSQVENDIEPNEVGLYLLQIVTEETIVDGFYWKNEDSDPGIYIQE